MIISRLEIWIYIPFIILSMQYFGLGSFSPPCGMITQGRLTECPLKDFTTIPDVNCGSLLYLSWFIVRII